MRGQSTRRVDAMGIGSDAAGGGNGQWDNVGTASPHVPGTTSLVRASVFTLHYSSTATAEVEPIGYGTTEAE